MDESMNVVTSSAYKLAALKTPSRPTDVQNRAGAGCGGALQ